VGALLEDSVRVTELTVIAHTGWTTSDLLDTLASRVDTTPYNLVTLQIGVNNQFGRLPFSVFENEFPLLVARATTLADDRPGRLLVLSIPDYSVTPVGSQLDPDRVRGEIDGYNGFIRDTLDSTEVTMIDITDISRQAADDPTLTARDGLHPSAKMYAEWVELIRPIVVQMLDPEPRARRSYTINLLVREGADFTMGSRSRHLKEGKRGTEHH
jgi:lysophospholipase L1-like esterase